MQFKSNLWLTNKSHAYFGKGRIELLQRIHETGSISKAAKTMKMSYKAAWDAINEMNTLSDEPIVVRETGGKGGGGTILTPKGLDYILLYKELENAQRLFFETLERHSQNSTMLEAFTSKLTLRTSARNQITGSVSAIEQHKTNAKITIAIADTIMIKVIISAKSLLDLDIQKGGEVTVLLKSTWLTLFKTLPLEADDKNCLQGDVADIEEGDENHEVTINLASHNKLVASISTEMKNQLALQKGDVVWVTFDSNSPLLSV